MRRHILYTFCLVLPLGNPLSAAESVPPAVDATPRTAVALPTLKDRLQNASSRVTGTERTSTAGDHAAIVLSERSAVVPGGENTPSADAQGSQDLPTGR